MFQWISIQVAAAPMLFRHWKPLLALLLYLASGPAMTQSIIAVPNVPRPLVEASAAKFTAMSASLGKVESVANGADKTKFDLVYTAPASATAGQAAVVLYTSEGGTEKKLDVRIETSSSPWGQAYGPVFQVLFTLFVVAVLLEWALAVIFNWRPFLLYFDARGAKTVFTVAFAVWLVNKFDLDVTAKLVGILNNSHVPSDGVSKFISALVLSGGSSGVNSLLVALGFRSVRTPDSVQPKPPPTKAWISVSLVRSVLVKGPADVLLSVDNGPPSVISQIKGGSPHPFFLGLLRNSARFPSYGGFPLDPGKTYRLQVKATDPNSPATPYSWGPFIPAAGGIIDVVATL